MDKFLSRLIQCQEASLVVRPCKDGLEGHSLEGELSIVVKGDVHTFVVQRGNIRWIVAALESAFIAHDWSGGVSVIEVHNGVAEVTSGNATIVDFDMLQGNACPYCKQDLGKYGLEARRCPDCHYTWTKEDE